MKEKADIYIKLTIRSLQRLTTYKEYLQNYKDRLDEVTIISNTSLNEKTAATNKIYSITEDTAVRIHEIKYLMKSLDNRIKTIETNLNKLPKLEKEILTARYIDELTIEKAAKTCQCSNITIWRKEKIALKKLTDFMYSDLYTK